MSWKRRLGKPVDDFLANNYSSGLRLCLPSRDVEVAEENVANSVSAWFAKQTFGETKTREGTCVDEDRFG